MRQHRILSPSHPHVPTSAPDRRRNPTRHRARRSCRAGARHCQTAAPKGRVTHSPSIPAAPTRTASALNLSAPFRPTGNSPSLPQLRPARQLALGPVHKACSDCLFPFGERCWMSLGPKENKESAPSCSAPPSCIPLFFSFPTLESGASRLGGPHAPLGTGRCQDPSQQGAAWLGKWQGGGQASLCIARAAPSWSVKAKSCPNP